MMFVKILGCIAAIAATLPLSADLIPTYNYFYSCDSGLVDCGSFGKHYYGDFGMTGPQPQFSESATTKVLSSNQRGEVVGHFFHFYGTLFRPFYGAVGEIFPLPFATDMSVALDINNNGLYLVNGIGSEFNYWFADYIGVGQSTSGLWNHISPQVASGLGVDGLCHTWDTVNGCNRLLTSWFLLDRTYFINDYDQILSTITIVDDSGYRTVDGVLSPHAVPEPHPVILFGIVNGLALLIRSRRKPPA